jgi:hypothetical protein
MTLNWKAALALGSVIVLALIAADAIQTYRAKMMLRKAAAATAAAASTDTAAE